MKEVFLLVCIFSVFCARTGFSQSSESAINPDAINYSLLSQLFNVQLNQLRKSKGLSELSSDNILTKAAADQALYCMQHDTLSHVQSGASKKEPSDRVRLYKGYHDRTGENCLYTYLFTPVSAKNSTDASAVQTYAEAAVRFFTMWKNSPGHYRNMIEPVYDVQGIAFAYNPRSHKIFATQVFGTKPYKYPDNIGALLNEYFIKPYNHKICDGVEKENIYGYRVANHLYVKDGKVYIEVQYFKPFETIFKDADDELAIDVVFKDQFTCEKNNRLNGSPYYDGLMLKPVSFREIFKRNTARNGHLNAYICDLPREITGTSFQLNAVLIKNSCFCTYTYPVQVNSSLIRLINLEPYWDTLRTVLQPDSFNLTISQRVKFKQGGSEVADGEVRSTQNKLKNLGPFVTSVKMKAYTSVEGDEKVNLVLGQARAKRTIQKLKPFFPSSVEPVTSAEENWSLFFHQVKDTQYEFFASKTKPEIKSLIHDFFLKRLEPVLQAQRYSEFEIGVKGTYTEYSNADILGAGLQKGLDKKDYSLAHSIQSRIIFQYAQGKAPIDNISDYPFPPDSPEIPYFINLLAAKAINENAFEFDDAEFFKKTFRRFTSPKANYNFCLYAIKYWSVKGDTLIHPDALLKLINKCSDLAPRAAVNSLLLNYYLTAVAYYADISNHNKMVDGLTSIYDLFKKNPLDKDTAYKLGLYFSCYNSTQWAVELLEPFLPSVTDEEFMLLYLQAGFVNYQENYPTVYMDAVDRYCRLYPLSYKAWVGREYQLLRDNFIKDRYCR